MNQRRFYATGVVVVFAMVLAYLVRGGEAPPWSPPGAPSAFPERMPGGTARVGVRIRKGSTLGKLLQDRGIAADDVIAAALPVYDLARVRPDRDLELVYADGEDLPVAVRYAFEEDQAVVVEREGTTWKARLDAVAYDTKTTVIDVTLTRSLWEDGLDAGLRGEDLVRLAKIFEYELDFNTELVDGARFSLVAEVLTPVEGEGTEHLKDKIATLHAVRLVNGKDEITAIRFDPASGDPAYYHPDGSGMKKPFLRSPLEFSKVTSGFNPKRFHPILKTTRAHNGTDFGAPTGTPVRSVAEGVVTFAGKSGGHGNFVKVQHEGGYETSYSHLSRIRVKKGQKVDQGDLVGDVGSTGLATGPHLHFQMWLNGKYVDAMKIPLPNTSSLSVSEKSAFLASASQWLGMLPE